MNQEQVAGRITNPPEDIDEIVLESHSIWIGVGRRYKEIAAWNKQLQEHQLNLNKRLTALTAENETLKKALDKQNAELADLRKKVEKKKPGPKKKDTAAAK